ncbi:hypothetical protein TrVFT333_008880 [Trichoderma virens FT-333]|nr:hypothetical protein TrVFT333_008880 [Trichoderma virens FT-333]
MSSAALNGGKRHVDVLAQGWSTSSGNPRTADAAHRRRLGRPLAWPREDGRLVRSRRLIGHQAISINPYRVACAEAGSEDLNRGTESRLWVLPDDSVSAYCTQTPTGPTAVFAAFCTQTTEYSTT